MCLRLGGDMKAIQMWWRIVGNIFAFWRMKILLTKLIIWKLRGYIHKSKHGLKLQLQNNKFHWCRPYTLISLTFAPSPRSTREDQGALESMMLRSWNYRHGVQLLKYKSMIKQLSSTSLLKSNTAFRNCFGCLIWIFWENCEFYCSILIHDLNLFKVLTFFCYSWYDNILCYYCFLLISPVDLGKSQSSSMLGKLIPLSWSPWRH